MDSVLRPLSKPDIIIFIAQVVLLFVVVITSLVNLSIDNGNTNLWTMVLTSCLGYMMPNPRFKAQDGRKEQTVTLSSEPDNGILRDFAIQREQPPRQQDP